MPLIQLTPHAFTTLPSHPSLPQDPSRPSPKSYTITALTEALDHLSTLPTTLTTDPKPRSSPPSTAKVILLRGWRKPVEQGTAKPEFWVARQSEHVDSAGRGTASWAEFESGLRVDHATHEMEYTPSVSGVERLLEWSGEEIREVEVQGVLFKGVEIEGEPILYLSVYNANMVSVNLITHTFHPSALISPRSFISLTISAAYDKSPNAPKTQTQPGQKTKQPTKGFLTVQIPISAAKSTTPADLHQKITSSVPRKTIFANYASIERVTLLSSPATTTATATATTETPCPQTIEWTMATTSDAGGSIPQWVQRNWTLGGVPKAVVADVGLFIGWTMRRRSSRS